MTDATAGLTKLPPHIEQAMHVRAFAELGVGYYAAGRVALRHGSMLVCGTALHHTIELLLKSALFKHGTSLADLKSDGHVLPKLWQRLLRIESKLAVHDATIAELDPLWFLRYPDGFIGQSVSVVVGRGLAPGLRPYAPDGSTTTHHHQLDIDRIDALAVDALDVAGVAPWDIAPMLPEGLDAIVTDNRHAARWMRP